MDLKAYREKIDESVLPIIRMVQRQLVDRDGARQEDLDAALCLGAALESWERVDRECA